MWMWLFLLDPHGSIDGTWKIARNFSLKKSGWTIDGNLYQFLVSKPPALTGFGATLVLSTIVLPRNWALFRLNTEFQKVDLLDMKNPTGAEYHNTWSIHRISNLNIRDCRSRSPLSLWLHLSQIPWELTEYDLTAKKLRKSGYIYVPIPPKLSKADNVTARGILAGTIKQTRSKAIDMWFYWLKDQTAQGQSGRFWEPGKHNLADYPTKHHSGAHHQAVQPIYLYNKNSSRA